MVGGTHHPDSPGLGPAGKLRSKLGTPGTARTRAAEVHFSPAEGPVCTFFIFLIGWVGRGVFDSEGTEQDGDKQENDTEATSASISSRELFFFFLSWLVI